MDSQAAHMVEGFGNLVTFQWLGLSPQSHLGFSVQFFVSDVPQIRLLLTVAIILPVLIIFTGYLFNAIM